MLFYKFESLSHFISSHISSMVLSDSIAKKKNADQVLGFEN